MQIREQILSIFYHALNSVKPLNVIKNALTYKKGVLSVYNKQYNLNAFKDVYVFGSGKASVEMAKAILPVLGKRITSGLVVANYTYPALETIQVVQGTHPVPTEKSVEAADTLIDKLSHLTKYDFYIYLLSGGTSALLERPLRPLTLNDLQAVTNLLLKSGVPIEEFNVVRKHLSMIKGGKLAQFTRAKGIVLVVSDVIGDPLASIGSGPLYAEQENYPEAYAILQKYALWEKLPHAVKSVIQDKLREAEHKINMQKLSHIDHFIVANNMKLLMQAKEKAKSLGIKTHIMSSRLKGEAKDVAKAIVSIGKEILLSKNPFKSPVCLLFGGETTVTLHGNGKGGRNQEMCLSALQEIKDMPDISFLSAGTDGIDGNSDAAGAIIDNTSYQKAIKNGLNIDNYLSNNDSNTFFKRTGDLIQTGYTGTNVMDISILYVT